jgi:uncharacterized protein YkwD
MKVTMILLIIPFLLSKEERTFKKLNKVYEKNTEKAFVLAKKISAKDKTLASPYYFQFLVYQKKADKTHIAKEQAPLLINAITMCGAFEKRAGESLLATTDFESKKSTLKEKVISCLKLLKNDTKNKSKFKKLRDKSVEFFSDMPQDVVTIIDSKKEAEEKAKLAAIEKEKNIENQLANLKHEFPSNAIDSKQVNFSKKPTGSENLASFNEAEELKMIDILNRARLEKNLQPLTIDPDLVRVARYHAMDMAKENYFSHESQNKVKNKLTKSVETFERIKLFYPTGGNSENIHAGSADAEGAYEAWFNSPGHYDNLFSETSQKVGIGFMYDVNSENKYYWVFCTSTN